MSKLDLSIIIVNYRSWDVLQECLDSLNQHSPKLSYEVIVVDNDSQDGRITSFSQEHPSVNFIENSGNYGFSDGCNLGAENATGEYLLFLNPDVILTDSPAIDEMVSFAKDNPGVGITSCRTINPNNKPEREISFLNPWLIIGWVRMLYKLIHRKKILEQFPENHMVWYPDWIAGSVVTISKDFFNQIGGWSQQHFWMYSEDPDLCKKARAQNKEIALLRGVELKHAHGGSSRRNSETTAITKSEVITSSHVFVQIHTQGINRLALHALIILNSLVTWSLRTLLTLPIFWGRHFQSNLLTLASTIRYYTCAPIRGTWRSNRLKPDKGARNSDGTLKYCYSSKIKTTSKNSILKFFVKEYRKKISKKLFIEANGIVDRGPFKGMHLGTKIHWGKADVAAKIFGLYESEVLDVIKDKTFDSLINLGAADGYYPIGMLMHNMVQHAYCFEENPLGKEYINKNAQLNNVNSGISLYGIADSQFYNQLPKGASNGNNLILCDIEGGEFDLFTDDVVAEFNKSTFIIELHDFKFDKAQKKRNTLIDRFKDFNVKIIQSKPKQWTNIEQITKLGDNDRALICSEGRRVLGEWLIATPKK